MKKPAEAGSGCFCYEVFPTLGCVFTRPMRTVSRLLLLFLLDLRSSPTVLPSLLSSPIDPVSSPPKYTVYT